MEWQPIDTVPRDGTRILGWNKTHGMHECWVPENVAHYSRVEAVYGNRSSNSNRHVIWFIPTHWMPLPVFRGLETQ